MNYFEKFLLNQHVIPVIIMYSLLPRSFYYKKWTLIIGVFAIIFSLLTLMYFIIRYNIAKRYCDKNKLILDSIIALAGVIVACAFNCMIGYFIWITMIPLFINNYKIVNKKI